MYSPLPGTYKLRYRQSSLWFWSRGSSLRSCRYLPLGMFINASVLLEMSGNLCGHTGGKESASLVPVHGWGGPGGMYRLSPTGGAAYGTPLNTSTGSRCFELSSSIIPRIEPDLVSTILELNRGPATVAATVSASITATLISTALAGHRSMITRMRGTWSGTSTFSGFTLHWTPPSVFLFWLRSAVSVAFPGTWKNGEIG